MTEKQSDTKETSIEELQCHKKYVYDTGIIFECKNNCKSEIIGEDVVDLLNELATKCSQLKKENEQLKSEIDMLKTTIGRNEGYIDRLTHKGEWR